MPPNVPLASSPLFMQCLPGLDLKTMPAVFMLSTCPGAYLTS